MLRGLLAAALVLLAACGSTNSTVPDKPVDDGYHPFNDPNNRPHREVVGGWDIEHYRIEITLDPASDKISGTTTIRAKRVGPGPVELDAVGLTIAGVTINGASQNWEYEGDKLRVSPSMDDATVGITYSATPRHGLFRVADPAMIWSQGETEYNAHWFPCWAPPNDFATSEVIAHVPAGMTAISNGVLMEKRDGFAHWKNSKPMASYLISLIVGDFERVEIGGHRVPVDVYVPRGRYDLADVKRTFQRTPAMIEFIEQKTGVTYPWPKYSQVVVKDFFWGGMENTSATTLYEHAVVKEAHANERDMDGLIVHELAHQWFGNLVTCRTWSEIWLNEGFATYFEYLWELQRSGPVKAAKLLHDWAEAVLDADYQRPIVTTSYTHPDDVFDSHSYEKGAWVLRMLHQEIGDDAFWKGIRSYLQKQEHKPVTTADLRAAMQQQSGAALDVFFTQWTLKAGVPAFRVESTWDADTKTLRIKLRQTQKTDVNTPVFRGTIEIDVSLPASLKTVTVPIESDFADVYVAVDAKPLFADLDPRGKWLKALEWTKSHDELGAMVECGSALGRLWAMGELEADGDPKAAPLLAAKLDPDSARALAACNARTLVDAIAEAPALTGDIVRALAAIAERDDVGVLLRRIAREHASPLCRAAAWEVYGKREDSFEDLAAAAETFAKDEWMMPSILKGLSQREEPGALEIIGRALAADRPGRIRDTATEALGKFKGDAARRGLMGLIGDSRYQVRMGAIRALEEVGDKACADVLELRLSKECDGQMIQALRRTIRKLRSP